MEGEGGEEVFTIGIAEEDRPHRCRAHHHCTNGRAVSSITCRKIGREQNLSRIRIDRKRHDVYTSLLDHGQRRRQKQAKWLR
jgi:hypothetical protein